MNVYDGREVYGLILSARVCLVAMTAELEWIERTVQMAESDFQREALTKAAEIDAEWACKLLVSAKEHIEQWRQRSYRALSDLS